MGQNTTPTAPRAPDSHVWYFAYGSNMARAVFIGHRHIQPLSSVRVRLPGWTLVFDIPGMPYKEPVFASIRPLTLAEADAKKPEVLGVAYLLTWKQYLEVVGSEGGGAMYADVALAAVLVDEEDGEQMVVRTMQAALRRADGARPSRRYMDLILDGSIESHLPLAYHSYLSSIPTYVPPRPPFRRLGAQLFLLFWMPFINFAHSLVELTISPDDGHAPPAVQALVRALFIAMWAWHDWVHAPIWGRGDGADCAQITLN